MPLYNVRAPNGKLYQVEGPDNADPNFLVSSARQLYEQEEDRRLRREYGPGLLGTVGESIGRGVEQLKTTFGDVIPAMAGKALGFEDYAARQMQEAQEAQQRIQAEYPSMFGSYKEVQTPYEALQFGAEVIGEQIPNIATAVIPGLGGSTLAGRAAVGALTKEAAKRGLTGEAAQAFITEGVKRAANTGVNAGAFLGSYALNAPEIFQNIYEETGQMEVGVSMLFSVGAAALDSILPAQLAKNISGPLKVGIVEKVLEKSGMEPSLLRSVSAGLMKGVAGEGLTEGTQEAISITAEKFVAENPQVFGSKEWDRIMEAGVRGAIAGGGFGATGASVQRLRERAEEKRVAAEQAEQQQRYEEAAKLRSEVEQAEQEIAAIQAQQGQMALPGMEQPVYTELYTPEGIPEPTKVQKEKPSGQVEMFTEEGMLTPAAEKMATKDEKAAANRARQEEQRRLKEEKESRKRLLGAEQLTLPGLSIEEINQQQQAEEQLRAEIEATGQGDLFAGPPTTASTTEPTVETEPQVRKDEPIVGTVINKDLAVLRKALGVRGTPNALKLIAGKDLSDPTQAQDVKNILEAYANTTTAQGVADNIAEFLARPEFNVAPTQPEPTETQPTTEPTERKQRIAFGKQIGASQNYPGELSARKNLPAQKAARAGSFAGVLDALEKSKNPVIAEIARRARSLGTKIKINANAIETYEGRSVLDRQSDIDSAKMHLDALAKLRSLAPAVAQMPDGATLPYSIPDTGVAVFNEGQEGISTYTLGDVAKNNHTMFSPLGLPGEPKLRTKEDFVALLNAFERVTQKIGEDKLRLTATASAIRTGVAGNYNADSDTVEVPDYYAKDEGVLAHEIVHAQTIKAVANPTERQKPAVQRLNALYEHVKRIMEDRAKADRNFQSPYGVASIQEFIAEGLANPAFQYDLSRIPYANTTVWDKFVEAIANLLGIKNDNAFTELLTIYSELTNTPKPVKRARQRAQPTTEKTDEGTGFGGQPDTEATGTSVPDVSGSGAEPEGSSYTGDFTTADTGGLGESGDVAGRDTGTETGDVSALKSEAAENWDAMVGDKVPFANLSDIHKQLIQDKFDAGTLTRKDVQWVLDARQRIEMTERTNARNTANTSKDEDYALPKYTGPVFDARQQQLAQDGNLTGLLDNLISKSTAPELKRILQKIRSLGLKTKIVVGKLDNTAGSYASTTDTITLDPVNGMNEHTAVHELLHAAISHVLRNPNLPVTKQLTVLFTQLQNQLGGVYGAQDLQEFAAELVGNKEFQALLKTMKAPRSGNMFSKFMQVLAEFFGFSKGASAYDRGLQLISDALDISNDVEPNVGDLLFLGTPNGAAMGFNVIGKVSKSMPTLAGRAVEATRNYLSNMPDDIRALGMGLLRIDNIADIYQKDLPSIKKLLEFTEKRTGMQQQMIEQVNNNYMRFEKVAKKFPKQMEKMYAFAIDSRLAQVDVLNPEFKPSQENIAEYTRLKNVFNSLPSDVQQVYKDIRKDYVVAIKQYEDILLNSVQDPSARRKLEAQYRARQTQVAYVPFLRRGDYWVEYDENGERAVRAFESKREREMFIAKNLQGKPHRAYQNINEAIYTQGSLPPSSFVVKVMEALSKENASEQLKANVYQAYLTLFPAESLAKRAMKADLVRGMETDLVQGYGETMIKWARRLATSQYAPQIDIALREIADQGRKASEDPNKAGAVTAANNILQQSQFILNPTYGGMVNALTTFSYFTFIAGNISSALINLTTLPMFSYPVLGGEHGFDKAAKALAEGSKVTTNYIFNNKVPPKYEALFRALNDRAQLEHTQAREVLEGHRAKTGDYLGVKARVMDAISIPFAKGEVLNRGATSVAAYDLALSSGMSQADAIEYAVNINKKINTSGLSATAPKYMQHPLGRVFFTFKTFVWNHAFVTARAFHQAFKGESQKIRGVALRQLLGIYGMSASFAGILGLPFIGMATTLANMIAALGDDEDEPFDAKLELREFFGEFLSKGAINYTTNLEIANRVGAADLLFRDDPQSVADHGYVRTALGQIFGPAASFAIGVERGANLMADGHVVRGIEYMLPSFIRNVVKAGRFGQEGILNTKGEPIIDDISAYNLAMQVVGFSPANLSSTYEEIGLKKEYEREVMQRRTKLLNKYDMAKRSGDYELLQEAKEDIRNFNTSRKDPRARITEDTLRRSERAREAAERESVNGIRYNRALKSEIDEILNEE